jgi:hypothetical protein
VVLSCPLRGIVVIEVLKRAVKRVGFNYTKPNPLSEKVLQNYLSFVSVVLAHWIAHSIAHCSVLACSP